MGAARNGCATSAIFKGCGCLYLLHAICCLGSLGHQTANEGKNAAKEFWKRASPSIR